MAKVKLLAPIANRFGSWRSGEEYDCDAAEAKRLIAAGIAEPVKAKAKKAVARKASKATARE